MKAQNQDQVRFIESNQDCQIIIVFCTISSRIEADVEAAMCDIKGKGTCFEPVLIEVEIACFYFHFVCLQDFV